LASLLPSFTDDPGIYAMLGFLAFSIRNEIISSLIEEPAMLVYKANGEEPLIFQQVPKNRRKTSLDLFFEFFQQR